MRKMGVRWAKNAPAHPFSATYLILEGRVKAPEEEDRDVRKEGRGEDVTGRKGEKRGGVNLPGAGGGGAW